MRKSMLGLRIIAVTKLVSAALLTAVGFGLFHLMSTDLGDSFTHFVRRLHLDPENRFVTQMLSGISGISPKQLRAIDAGTFLYALLYVVEGIGLLMAKHWAEYLTIFATASLIPVEMYELARKLSAVRAAVLIINVVIVVYLVHRLRADRTGQPGY